MMRCLVCNYPSIECPCSTPLVLVIVLLIPAPTHSYASKNNLSESIPFYNFPEFLNGQIKPILLHNKQLYIIRTTN